jgi:hypothetical protein
LHDVETVIAALEKREIQELRTEWRKLYRAEPPRRLSRDLILRAIAYASRNGRMASWGSPPSGAYMRWPRHLRRKAPHISTRQPS